MDNLFDLNDYEDKEEEVQLPEDKGVGLELTKNPYQIDIDKPRDIINIDSNKEVTLENHDDSFETKITVSANKNLITGEAKEKSIYAIDDTIDVKEYDKITNPALTYPFELDVFQKRSIIRLENHQNVLVCAHTSSGKTVVAEYAIALGRSHGKRVFYTSPIKALSNQKYREFKGKFGDVGILTGDVSINSDAQCVIMTTEILQSSLYKNSEMLNLVDWVVFDEVHYINDNERGHVWEEILILLPPRIGIVMLSATVPNYLDFAKWVGRIKSTTIYIQNTLKRVVPLEHNIFLGCKKIFTIKDKNEKVIETNINQAMKELEDINNKEFKNKNNPKNKKEKENYEAKKLDQIRNFYRGLERKEKDNFNKGKSNNNNQNYNQNNYNNSYKLNRLTMTHLKLEEIVKFLFESELTPAVVFVFSIKKIDEYARMLAIDPRVTKGESSKIISFFDKCMSKLSEEDKQINQIQLMRRILPQGIGVHHAGLLPILKETIEILYSNGLIKILFATTSFSIGLNMPTRTVVFTDVEKYNDEKKEILSSSEYLQMCGRAGRRGIDTIGNIYLLMGDKKNPPQVKDLSQMVGGKGTHVESKFRLSYRTIISFLSRNIKNIMEFFKESYLENNKILIMPETMKEVEEIKEKLLKLDEIQCKFPEGDGDEFIRLYDQDNINIKKYRISLFSNANIASKLTQGRMVMVRNKTLNKNLPALILHYYEDYEEYRCLFADNSDKTIIQYEKDAKTTNLNQGVLNKIFYEYDGFYIDDIVEIFDSTLKIDKSQIYFDQESYCFIKSANLDKVLNNILETCIKANKVMDYLKVSNRDIEVFEMIKNKDESQRRIRESKCDDCEYRQTHWKIFKERKILEEKFKEKSSMLSSENLKYYNDFKNRLQILQKLGYIDKEDQILLKGKAARELATSDCLLISELLMSNILDKLDIAETVAFISGFAFSRNEIETEDPMISDNFSLAVKEFAALLDGLMKLENSMEFEESKYNRRITFAVSKSIYLWMNNCKFKDILEDTDLEEGKLYNLIMRLYLFLEEIKNFATTLGNTKLAEKFQKAKESIMRDILSCRSLYLQEDVDIDNI